MIKSFGINKLGIGIGQRRGSSGLNGALQAKFLFWGKYSEITGGHMPNKVTGSSDYLTVSGSAGSETYQCPNTAPYIAADTDYIWFNINGIIRTVTTSQLVSYDFQRTPVGYENISPFALNEIIILEAGETLTDSEKDHLSSYLNLYAFFFTVQNDYGYFKENRPGLPWVIEEGETATLLSAFSVQPSAAQRVLINSTIKGIKDNGLWSTADVIRFYYANDEQSSLLNWKNTAVNLATKISTPTFTTKSGWRSPSVGKVLNENFTPSTNGGNYTLNDASVIYYVSNTSQALVHLNGVVDGTKIILWGIYPGGGLQRINQNAPGQITTQGGDGLNGLIRTGSGLWRFALNNSQTSSGTSSSGLPARPLYTLGTNSGGLVAYENTATIFKFIYIGASMTHVKFMALKTIVEAYITSF